MILAIAAAAPKAFSLALNVNPALWLLLAAGVGAFLEALSLLVLFRVNATLSAKVAGAFTWCIHPLTGPDGRPSFSKIIDLLIIGAYTAGAQIPEGVAMLVIGSAHGTKVLLAVIDKLTLNVSSATSLSSTKVKTENNTTERHIIERIERGEPSMHDRHWEDT